MTYFFGDTHGSFLTLNEVLQSSKKEDIFIICGDFGYWRKAKFKQGKGWFHDNIDNPHGSKIFWCDGNHEDFMEIEILTKNHDTKNPIEIQKNLYYCPRGSSLKLSTGENILFMGGALSIDKYRRTAYYDWFPQETISFSDISNLPNNKTYDIIVSHTCPKMCEERMFFHIGFPYKKNEKTDESCEALQYVFDLYKPKKWFYGHWHLYDEFVQEGCSFTVLNMTGKEGHYCELKK